MAIDVFICERNNIAILTHGEEKRAAFSLETGGEASPKWTGPEIHFAMRPKVCHYPHVRCYIAVTLTEWMSQTGGLEHHALA